VSWRCDIDHPGNATRSTSTSPRVVFIAFDQPRNPCTNTVTPLIHRYHTHTHTPVVADACFGAQQARDKLGLGDSRNTHGEARVREAPRLAGDGDSFIVRVSWHIQASNAKIRSGRKIDFDSIREVIGAIGRIYVSDSPLKVCNLSTTYDCSCGR